MKLWSKLGVEIVAEVGVKLLFLVGGGWSVVGGGTANHPPHPSLVTADNCQEENEIPPGIEKSFLGLKILPGRISRSREGFGRNQNVQAHQIPPVASGNYRVSCKSQHSQPST